MMTNIAMNTLTYDPALCNGCALCTVVCPHSVFAMKDHQARLVRWRACMECGACQLNCPTAAIHVESGAGCAYLMMKEAIASRLSMHWK